MKTKGKPQRPAQATKRTADEERDIVQVVRLETETANRSMGLWHIRTACVLKALADSADELAIEARKPGSPLAYLEGNYLTDFVKGVEDAERALRHLLPPCECAILSPVAVLRSLRSKAK